MLYNSLQNHFLEVVFFLNLLSNFIAFLLWVNLFPMAAFPVYILPYTLYLIIYFSFFLYLFDFCKSVNQQNLYISVWSNTHFYQKHLVTLVEAKQRSPKFLAGTCTQTVVRKAPSYPAVLRENTKRGGGGGRGAGGRQEEGKGLSLFSTGYRSIDGLRQPLYLLAGPFLPAEAAAAGFPKGCSTHPLGSAAFIL